MRLQDDDLPLLESRMMRIVVLGAGYVGLVTGIGLARLLHLRNATAMRISRVKAPHHARCASGTTLS